MNNKESIKRNIKEGLADTADSLLDCTDSMLDETIKYSKIFWEDTRESRIKAAKGLSKLARFGLETAINVVGKLEEKIEKGE